MNSYECLIIFMQKIESMTANYYFHKFYDVINADVAYLVSKECVYNRGTVLQKHFTTSQVENIFGQKIEGGGSPTPPPLLSPSPLDRLSGADSVTMEIK